VPGIVKQTIVEKLLLPHLAWWPNLALTPLTDCFALCLCVPYRLPFTIFTFPLSPLAFCPWPRRGTLPKEFHNQQCDKNKLGLELIRAWGGGWCHYVSRLLQLVKKAGVAGKVGEKWPAAASSAGRGFVECHSQ